MTSLPDGIFFDLVRAEEIEAAYAIEEQVFPADEAASLEALRYRQSNAPSLFLGAFLPSRTLLGYVVSTLSTSPTLTHSSMSTHDPSGSSVCIHSVAVSPTYQRRGIALALLKEYVARLRRQYEESIGGPERALLITHEELRELYAKAGFEWVGKSAVVHGSKDWFEMRIDLTTTPDSSDPVSARPHRPPPPPEEMSQQAMLDALAAASASSRNIARSNAARPVSSFGSGLDDLTVDVDVDNGEKANKYRLVCLREGCGSVILLPKTAVLKEAPSISMEPASHPPPAPLLPSPVSGAPTNWWLITGSAMSFENIGFSRPASSLPPAPSGEPLKLLSCAECDLGPVGWSVQGGREFWVHCERVGYRVE